MRPDEFLEEFEIDSTPIWSADDDRLEPNFLDGPPWFEFGEFDQREPEPADCAAQPPLPFEFDEPQLDLERSGEELGEPWPVAGRRASATSLVGSIGMHLLVLLGLMNWSRVLAENPQPIPMQLVLEGPSSQEEKPPSRIVPDTEIISARPAETASGAVGAKASPPARPPQAKLKADKPPPKAKLAADKPPPKPSHAAKPSPPVKPGLPPEPRPPPEPLPRQLAAAAPATPTPATPAPPTPDVPPPAPATPAASQLAATPNPAPREAPTPPGPDTAQSDYFSRLVALTRDHLDLLPASFLAGRRGQTTLSIVVLGDGSVARISVKLSSGYPDIDARIEQMVAAVGRFPAPPEWFPKPSIELDFNLIFPDALPQ